MFGQPPPQPQWPPQARNRGSLQPYMHYPLGNGMVHGTVSRCPLRRMPTPTPFGRARPSPAHNSHFTYPPPPPFAVSYSEECTPIMSLPRTYPPNSGPSFNQELAAEFSQPAPHTYYALPQPSLTLAFQPCLLHTGLSYHQSIHPPALQQSPTYSSQRFYQGFSPPVSQPLPTYTIPAFQLAGPVPAPRPIAASRGGSLPPEISRLYQVHKWDTKTLEDWIGPLGDQCGFEFTHKPVNGSYNITLKEYPVLAQRIRASLPDSVIEVHMLELLQRIIDNRKTVFDYYESIGQSAQEREKHEFPIIRFTKMLTCLGGRSEDLSLDSSCSGKEDGH